jgi:anion-transporting  ArsA/GET3 family ATPase
MMATVPVKTDYKNRPGTTQGTIDYQNLPHIKKRDAIILRMHDSGHTLKQTAEAIRYLDSTGFGWSSVRVNQIYKRLRGKGWSHVTGDAFDFFAKRRTARRQRLRVLHARGIAHESN